MSDTVKKIFDRCIESKVDAIFMTPNMLNTSVSPETEDKYYEYAHKTADMQNNGRMDRYMTAAVELARSEQAAGSKHSEQRDQQADGNQAFHNNLPVKAPYG